MSLRFPLVSLFLILFLSACSGVETRTQETDKFEAGDYNYYKWRSAPLSANTNGDGFIHMIDPIVRKAVDKELAKKGYILNPDQAQFSVDYIYAEGIRTTAASNEVTGANYPGIAPSRDIDQASIDNAVALSGVKETSNLGLQFNDVASGKEVWRVLATKVIDRAAADEKEQAEKDIKIAVDRLLRPMPDASK